ncbi:microfibril-associated glycoprotein 4-like [Diadema antillarum]|uniref:microfibril-associated glycoprotein 4-like n=1 Tax=Diadema antillarum TaxID=105358 RepID=UPI003A84C108
MCQRSSTMSSAVFAVVVLAGAITGTFANVDAIDAPQTSCNCPAAARITFYPTFEIIPAEESGNGIASPIDVAEMVQKCGDVKSATEENLGLINDTQRQVSTLVRQPRARRVEAPYCSDVIDAQGEEGRPLDCDDALSRGFNVSGRYVIDPLDGGDPFVVYCDMDTDGGGWTVLQRRENGDENFDRSWLDYKHGFGNLMGEHWLGLEKMHRISAFAALRVDLEDFEGAKTTSTYELFFMHDEARNYEINMRNPAGDGGAGLALNGRVKFSTPDNDNDRAGGHCARIYKSGWWFSSCDAKTNLNGHYLDGGVIDQQGIIWKTWKNNFYSMKRTEMKVRPSL